MENRDYAQILLQVAQLLELEGKASPFEIRAYQNAGRIIANLKQNIEDIYFQKGEQALTKLKGIGKGIAGDISEIATTGTLKKLKTLREKLPTPLLDFAEIPGVGPKGARKLYRATGARTLKGLKTKLTTALKHPHGKLAECLAGVSLRSKSIKRIIESLNAVSRRTKRLTLDKAITIAQTILFDLREQKGVKRADAVGSLRRFKETVGDIDIIASLKKVKGETLSQTAQRLSLWFTRLEGVKRVVNQGETKSRVLWGQDLAQVDLELLPQRKYGSLLQHFTGSREHNVALRRFALEQGKSVSEHGIKVSTAGGKTQLISCPTEQSLYRALGLEYIPPELREGTQEIKLASKHQLPKLVSLNDIRGDLQMHTGASDGRASLEEMRAYASQLAYQYILITDHSSGLGITGGHTPQTLARERKRIDRLNATRKKLPYILLGIEVNIRADGSLDMGEESLSFCDLVVASIHSGFGQDTQTVTQRLLRAITHPKVNIIAHPSGRLINRREPLTLDWNKVFRASLRHQVALEINASPNRLDLDSKLARHARERGVGLVISSDAHSPEQLENMFLGVGVARRAWLTCRDILNTMGLARLLKWFQK